MDANRIGGRRALVAAAMIAGFALPAGAAEPNLSVELNKAEDSGGSCVASFVLRNELGHTLDRFNLDLFIFDGDGVIARQLLLDLAPLRDNKTTVFRFALIERPCAEIGHILINNVPSCRSEGTGETLDCLTSLAASSRSRVELVK